MSPIMRARPNAPASKPSCQSGRRNAAEISGSRAGNVPIVNVLAPVITHSRTMSRRDELTTKDERSDDGQRATVGILSTADGQVVREELQRHHGGDRRQELVDLGNRDGLAGQRGD